ncbi:hypothetical protein D3C80_1677520 [compost metagenome]
MRAAELLLEKAARIDVSRVSHHRSAQAFGEGQLVIVNIDRRHVQPHGGGVLDRQMPETADTGDDHPVAGLGIGHFQTLIDGDAGAEDR